MLIATLLVLAILTTLLLLSVAARIPVWNPIYYFGALSIAQIGSGLLLAEMVDYHFDPQFMATFCGAQLIMVATFFLLNLRYQTTIRRHADLRSVFNQTVLSPRVRARLMVILIACATVTIGVTITLTVRGGNLPVIAYSRGWRQLGVTMRSSGALVVNAYTFFDIPFLGVLQEAFTIVCVVIYCLLLLIPAASRRRGVPVFVHLLLLAVLFCSAVHVRRNSFMMAVAALLLTLHGAGRVR